MHVSLSAQRGSCVTRRLEQVAADRGRIVLRLTFLFWGWLFGNFEFERVIPFHCRRMVPVGWGVLYFRMFENVLLRQKPVTFSTLDELFVLLIF